MSTKTKKLPIETWLEIQQGLAELNDEISRIEEQLA